MNRSFPAPLCAAVLVCAAHAQAQSVDAPAPAASVPEATLPAVTVRASADASAAGLSPAYPGGQVARGGRAGILGTRDHRDTPFSITSYTNELIQDRLAKSVGEVLQNDPSVRTARGFGNFQESYFIRGFILGSDDVAYNGLYSLLPRQYIATELFERVEVLRGASAFLNGANPGGGGIGGAINLLPKRATDEPLNRTTLGWASGEQIQAAADLSRRFGPDNAAGVRINAALREGGTAIDDERAKLGLLAIGADWRSRDLRLSGDIGWQDNRLRRTRTNVTLAGVTAVPKAPDASSNFAQPWSYADERDLFGTLRAEWDVSAAVTGWAAYGARRGDEANSLANLDVTDATTGAASTSRFDNAREDRVDTGELGLRGTLRTGAIGHEWVLAASVFAQETKNAYAWDFFNTLATNLYTPTSWALPTFSGSEFRGGDLAAPGRTARTRLSSIALGDTLVLPGHRLRITLGARRQTLDITDYAYGSGEQTARYKHSRISPLLGAVFQPHARWSLYANHVEGLTRGETAPTFVSPPPANPGEALPPYVSKQREVGAKYDAGRFGASLAVFATRRPRALINAANVFSAEGEDRHRGVEVGAYGEARRGLRVLGGATWLDAIQKSTGSAATDGKRVIGVPRLQVNLGTEWDVPALSGLALDARVVHTGARYADAQNTLQVPGWTRLDVGARWIVQMFGGSTTWRARIDNLTDRDHWASVGGYPGQGYLVVGSPRSVTLSASIDF